MSQRRTQGGGLLSPEIEIKKKKVHFVRRDDTKRCTWCALHPKSPLKLADDLYIIILKNEVKSAGDILDEI